ncbi:MAG: aspartate/glutamate racemase family protein [Spirochaetales bacterium]|nr:aspartate/glutamate racemase family protein [Spirochaetales bacterium]
MNRDEALELFSTYMRLTGVPHLGREPSGGAFAGKRVGIINGGSWITLWSVYFGRTILPGATLVNVGNEAVQLSFMAAHARGLPTPPESNIAAFARYAHDLVDLTPIDAVLITCSTMNRSLDAVREALADWGKPIVQIDEAMMERVVSERSRPLVIATHGPTVASTQVLLRETAERRGTTLSFAGATIEEAFEDLGRGEVTGHNERIADCIRSSVATGGIDSVVLAQLSMSIFELSYPDPDAAFGIPVYTSGRTGFERIQTLLSEA